jgi:hypothetical protein
MKNSRTSEALFAITNKYALAEEATLNTREQKMEKELSHMDQPSLSKGHDKEEESGLFRQCGGTAMTQQGVPAQAG